MGGEKQTADTKPAQFTLSVPTLIKATCALPLFATLFCVVWSIMFDFNKSTRTHCKVYNFLPTISAVIGGFTPQRYVWRICIALHAPQRLMVAIGYYNFHTSVHVGNHNGLYRKLAALTSLLNILEVLSLVCLSMISSSENHALHENLFISFMACGLFYMLLTIILMRWGRFSPNRTPSVQEVTSLRYKTRLFLFKLLVFAVAVYLFFRHNAYCEPGVYSLFAALEYVVVVSNIAFHATLYWDFGQHYVLGMAHSEVLLYTGFAFFEYLTVLSNIAFHSLIVVDFHNTDTLMVECGRKGTSPSSTPQGPVSSESAVSRHCSVSNVLDFVSVAWCRAVVSSVSLLLIILSKRIKSVECLIGCTRLNCT